MVLCCSYTVAVCHAGYQADLHIDTDSDVSHPCSVCGDSSCGETVLATVDNTQRQLVTRTAQYVFPT